MRKFLLSNSALHGVISKPMTMTRAALSCRSLLSDRRGVVAIEFAVLAPIMLMIFFGMVEVTAAVNVDRRLAITANALNQIVNASPAVTDADLDNDLAGLPVMLQPYDASTATASVTEFFIDPATSAATVQWTRGDNAPGLDDFSGAGLSPGYYVMTKATYLYIPWVTSFFVPESGIPFTEIAIRPTRAGCIGYNGAGCPQ